METERQTPGYAVILVTTNVVAPEAHFLETSRSHRDLPKEFDTPSRGSVNRVIAGGIEGGRQLTRQPYRSLPRRSFRGAPAQPRDSPRRRILTCRHAHMASQVTRQGQPHTNNIPGKEWH